MNPHRLNYNDALLTVVSLAFVLGVVVCCFALFAFVIYHLP
jgi:hypothetical protein